eukprot:scaffold678474_cov45-Prasinocladus_malaysianus.AAC.1
MTCEEHDRQAASTQFITHTVGRMLGEMGLESTTINTKGYESLLNLVDNTANDSFELYYGLFMYNQSATQELQRLEQAFDKIRVRLMDELHDKLRQEIFGPAPVSEPKVEVLPRQRQLKQGSDQSNGSSSAIDIKSSGSN